MRMNGDKGHEVLELRRRMFIDALGVKPKDLKMLLGLQSPKISFILGGTRRLNEAERGKLTRMIEERVDLLFG